MGTDSHTPGPWAASILPHHPTTQAWHTVNSDDGFICHVASAADAHLIAAAPELKEALRQIIDAAERGGVEFNSPEIGGDDDIPPHPWHEEWLHYARAALSKASAPGGTE